MPTKKSTATNRNPKNPDNPVQVLQESACPTSSGKSTLGYQVGTDDSGAIHLKVSSNDGGGMFSPEWVNYTDIQAAIEAWPEDQGITSMTFRKIFRGKSANTPGFLIAILVAAGLLETMEGKSRVHQACDPSKFLDSVAELQNEAGNKPGGKPTAKAKPRAKAKAAPKAKAKADPKAKAKAPRKSTAKTAKTPRKTTAASRKTK